MAPQLRVVGWHNHSTKTRLAGLVNEQSVYSYLSMHRLLGRYSQHFRMHESAHRLEHYILLGRRGLHSSLLDPLKSSEAIFLVMRDPSMNKLWVTKTGLCVDLYGSRSRTTPSWKGHTQLKIQPLKTIKCCVVNLLNIFRLRWCCKLLAQRLDCQLCSYVYSCLACW